MSEDKLPTHVEILVAIEGLKTTLNNFIDSTKDHREAVKDQLKEITTVATTHSTRINKLENEKYRMYGIAGGIALALTAFGETIKKTIGLN